MEWIYLLIAGILEWGWPVGLKYAWTEKGFSLVPAVFAILFILASGFFLFMAQRTIPVGTAYAVWTGIGAVGVAILGMVLFGESRDVLRITCLFLIIAGIVGLKLVS